MKNRPSATGDLVAATPKDEAKASKNKKSQRLGQRQKIEPLCELKNAVKGMIILEDGKASQFIKKDNIENSYILDEKPFAR